MRKIDLHIHTIATPVDAQFTFSLTKLVEYVKVRSLDIIGVTNHNVFNLEQYRTIVSSASCIVLPGIEINLEGGHLLVLTEPSDAEDFSVYCNKITDAGRNTYNEMNFECFKAIFPAFHRYLIIPHYEKKPQVSIEVISKLGDIVTAGEVTSPKKFVYCVKDPSSLVPVFFSDSRMDSSLTEFPFRQTFIDIGDISLGALKYALRDRNKVALTNATGHHYFQATPDGLVMSTGLNIVLGERSSGKTYTLDALERNFERVKYIRQFSLVEKSDQADAERYNTVLRQSQSTFIEGYFKEFKDCVEAVAGIDLDADSRSIENYISSLVKHALDSEKSDAFSKTIMFGETLFSDESLSSLEILIEAAINLADNNEYRDLIDRYIPRDSLKSLVVALMEQFVKEDELRRKKRWVNDLISSIKAELRRKTATTSIPDIDFYKIAMNRQSVNKFCQIADLIKSECQIFCQEIQLYKIIAKKRPFMGAGEMKTLSRTQLAFSNAFQEYNRPYQFLQQLKSIVGLPTTDYYKFFATIEYKILNRFGAEVSGGERSEFRLLQEISDALQYDMLLIDEPESSFDNLFLNSEVNQLIKEISKSMPVIVVTHNNTVGASIKPDFIIYTKRTITNGTAKYETYFGHPSDKELRNSSDATQPNHKVMLNCLEAGVDAYRERGLTYETLKN